MLEGDLAENEGGSSLGKFLVQPFGGSVQQQAGLTERELEVLQQVGERPVHFRKVAVSTTANRAIASLRKKGLLQYCTFTPSDAACALGLQDNWPRQAAVLAAKLMVRFRDMKLPDEARTETFCREVWARTVSLSARVLLETAMGPQDKASAAWDAVCEGRGRVGLVHISLKPSVPIVAVGGPVKVYYGEVGRRLGCEVVFAPFCDVANAVGAAAGQVADRTTVTVEGDGNGAFRVHGAGRTELFGSGSLALAAAQKLASGHALELATTRGARDPRITLKVEKTRLPDAKDDDGLLTAVVVAEAIGLPA